MQPPRLVRTGVLVTAVACLGLAMCARAKPPAPPAPAQPLSNQQARPLPPDAAPAPPARPTYFPATKAPAQLYR
jgi:hypothetical protein